MLTIDFVGVPVMAGGTICVSVNGPRGTVCGAMDGPGGPSVHVQPPWLLYMVRWDHFWGNHALMYHNGLYGHKKYIYKTNVESYYIHVYTKFESMYNYTQRKIIWDSYIYKIFK